MHWEIQTWRGKLAAMFRAPHALLHATATQVEQLSNAAAEHAPAQRDLARTVSGSVPFVQELWNDGVTASQRAFQPAAALAQWAFDPATALALNAYDRYLARVPYGPRPDDAASIGAELLRLEAVLGRECLTYLSGGSGSSALLSLIDGGFVDSFIVYVEECKPALHAKNGRDFSSFMKHEKDFFSTYRSLLPYVRSLHRLHPDVLQPLADNIQDQSKSRPVVVVVMSALDVDGSLHGNKSLIPLVSQTKTLVLAIEAGERQEGVIDVLQKIATDFGQEKRIQDIVFVSRGGPEGIGLAGSVSFTEKNRPDDATSDLAAGEYREGDVVMGQSRLDFEAPPRLPEVFDFSHRAFKAEQFVRRLLMLFDTRWGTPITPRIVFDASLVNAHKLKFSANSKPPEIEVRDALAKARNLPDFVREFAGHYNLGKGQVVDIVEIVAANGYLEPNALAVDDDGRPTLRSKTDPAITATKAEYVAGGSDPEGVLRALVELWNDAWPIVEQRIQKPIEQRDPWTGDVMHAMLSVALDHCRSNPSGVNSLAAVGPAMRSLGGAQIDQATEILNATTTSLGPKMSGQLFAKLTKALDQSNSLPLDHPARYALRRRAAATAPATVPKSSSAESRAPSRRK